MIKVAAVLACVIGLAGPAVQAQVNSGDLQWGPAPPGLPAGSQVAVLSGDPTKPGTFTLRAKLPAGYKIAPHHHPTDEYVTVLTGELDFGMGDAVGAGKVTHLGAGGFVNAMVGMNHYLSTKDGAVIQVTAQGPFVIIYVNPADDPRNH